MAKAKPLTELPVKFAESYVRGLLDERVIDAGSQSAFAKALGISPQYLSDVLARRRGISDQLARKIGFAKVEYFIRLEDCAIASLPTQAEQVLEGIKTGDA